MTLRLPAQVRSSPPRSCSKRTSPPPSCELRHPGSTARGPAPIEHSLASCVTQASQPGDLHHSSSTEPAEAPPPPTRRPACFTQHQPSSSPAPSPDSSRPTRSQPLRAPQTSTLDEPLYPLSDQPLRHSPHRLRWLHRPAELEACPLLRPTWRSSTPIRAGPLLAPGFISWPACSTQRRVHQTNTTPPVSPPTVSSAPTRAGPHAASNDGSTGPNLSRPAPRI
jgi:hypothetical protein